MCIIVTCVWVCVGVCGCVCVRERERENVCEYRQFPSQSDIF